MRPTMRLIAVALVFTFSMNSLAIGEFEENPLTVSLFYESYCPFCKGYIENKLYVAWTTLKGHILIDLLPFGNTEQSYVDGHWEFSCQHGPMECLGNKLHACGVSQACGDKGTRGCDVDKLDKVMDFIYCVIRTPDQLQATNNCAKSSGLDGDAIISCAKGDQGDTLFNLYGNRTIAFEPKIQYVPNVAINGKHSVAAENDLVGEICKLQPELCKALLAEVISV